MPNASAPVVILVRPQLGENIGAVARAMSNFGLSELRIVVSRDGWPNGKARDMAAGAESIIEAAQIFPDFPAALHDVQLAYATSARPRDIEKPVVPPQEAMAEIGRHLAGKMRVALVFGPERSGLENEDITLCDTLIAIPTSTENRSLNIAQAAVIVGYEWWKANGDKHAASEQDNKTQYAAHNTGVLSPPAPKEDFLGLFNQLESYLDAADYFRTADKKTLMWQNLKTMLLRAQWNPLEVRTFRGMLRSLWEGNPKK